MRTLDGSQRALAARFVILACGTLEVTRLLENCVARGELDLGESVEWLGKNYMGHISGRIARVVFSTDPKETVYGFHRDRDGVYVRPRFTISAECQLKERIEYCVLARKPSDWRRVSRQWCVVVCLLGFAIAFRETAGPSSNSRGCSAKQ